MADAAAHTRRMILGVGAAVALTVAVVVAAPPPPGASTWSLAPSGLRAAHDYLQARGAPVARWQRPLAELPPEDGTVLFLATPLSEPWTDADQDAVDDLLDAGGRLVLAWDGQEPTPLTAAMLRAMDLWWTGRGGPGPLWWGDWQDWSTAPVALPVSAELDREAGAALPGPLQGRRISTALVAPPRAEILWADPEGLPVGYRLRRGRGEIVVLSDRSPLGNADLAAAANLAALEWLVAGADAVWFDEVHHGHLDAAELDLAGVLGPFEALLAHAALLWALWVLATARRFGPILDRPLQARSSLDRELQALGALHHRAGHAREAALRLADLLRHRGRRRGGLPADLAARLDDLPEAPTTADLLALARAAGDAARRGLL